MTQIHELLIQLRLHGCCYSIPPMSESVQYAVQVMEDRNLLLIIEAQTFHITYTKHIPLYSSPPLGISTIVIHVSSTGMRSYWNASFVKLTSLSQRRVSGSFSCVT